MGCTRTAYPTGEDLKSFMLTTGTITADELEAFPFVNIDYDLLAGEGVEEFETAIGRKMLATADTTRTISTNEDSRLLRLRTELCSITSVTVGGVALTRNTQYRLLPEDAEYDNRPWDIIELLVPPTNRWSNIAIAGKWGRWTCIPDDAFGSMIRLAAKRVIPAIEAHLTGGSKSWGEADVNEAFADHPFAALTETWQTIDYGDGKANSGVIGRYTRRNVGV